MNLLEDLIELLINNIHKSEEIHSKRIDLSSDEINFRLQSMYNSTEIDGRNNLMSNRGV